MKFALYFLTFLISTREINAASDLSSKKTGAVGTGIMYVVLGPYCGCESEPLQVSSNGFYSWNESNVVNYLGINVVWYTQFIGKSGGLLNLLLGHQMRFKQDPFYIPVTFGITDTRGNLYHSARPNEGDVSSLGAFLETTPSLLIGEKYYLGINMFANFSYLPFESFTSSFSFYWQFGSELILGRF